MRTTITSARCPFAQPIRMGNGSGALWLFRFWKKYKYFQFTINYSSDGKTGSCWPIPRKWVHVRGRNPIRTSNYNIQRVKRLAQRTHFQSCFIFTILSIDLLWWSNHILPTNRFRIMSRNAAIASEIFPLTKQFAKLFYWNCKKDE